MLRDIEASCLYLFQVAKKLNLDLDKILNHTAKNGNNLFSEASIYSEEITKFLLDQNVKVNSITHNFVTPFFRVGFEIDFRK